MGKAKVNSVLSAKSKGLISPFFIRDSNISDAILKISNFIGESVPVVNNKGLLKGVITGQTFSAIYSGSRRNISYRERLKFMLIYLLIAGFQHRYWQTLLSQNCLRLP